MMLRKIKFVKRDLIYIPLTAVVMAWVWVTFFQNTDPPIEILSAEFVQKEAKPGDVVTLKIKGYRHRICPANVSSFWIPDEGAAIQNPVVSASPVQKIGLYAIAISKTIPAETAAYGPMMWSYVAHIIPECNVEVSPIVQNPVRIMVVP